MTLKLEKLTDNNRKLINHALGLALRKIDTAALYVLRPDHQTESDITPATREYLTELIRECINDQTIQPFAQSIVASILAFAAWDLEVWVDGYDSDDLIERDECFESYRAIFGYDADDNTATELRSLARRLCPYYDVNAVVATFNHTLGMTTPYSTIYSTLLRCKDALKRSKQDFENSTLPGYKNMPRSIGIVVNGTWYDIPEGSSAASSIKRAICNVYSPTRKEVNAIVQGANADEPGSHTPAPRLVECFAEAQGLLNKFLDKYKAVNEFLQASAATNEATPVEPFIKPKMSPHDAIYYGANTVTLTPPEDCSDKPQFPHNNEAYPYD